MSAARRVEAPVQLRLLAAADPVPVAPVRDRERRFSCGCVERGYWRSTAQPPLQWWIHTSRRPCPRHVHGRVGGGEE